IGEYFVAADWLSGTGLVFLYALVSGGFLYISTTIVFESSPGHHFNAKRLLVALAGSLMAVAVEYLF
nr:zinc permease [Cyclobacteriaceae bacterium]